MKYNITALHDLEVCSPVLGDVALKGSVVETVQVLLDLVLEDIVVLPSHFLEPIHHVLDVGRRLLEVVQALVHYVIACIGIGEEAK